MALFDLTCDLTMYPFTTYQQRRTDALQVHTLLTHEKGSAQSVLLWQGAPRQWPFQPQCPDPRLFDELTLPSPAPVDALGDTTVANVVGLPLLLTPVLPVPVPPLARTG